MALTINYAHSSNPGKYLAKAKIGSETYYLKDADLRAIVEAFGTATAKDSTNAVTSTGVALPTESAVYDFVVSQVGALGKVINLRSETDHTAISNAAKGDMVVESSGSEWLYDGSAWREVGSENAYVLKTAKIAGIDHQDDITSAELSTALDLKAFAHASQGTTDLTNYVTGLEGADYTPVGDVNVTLSQNATAATLTKSDYTPAGDVDVTLSQTATAATLTSSDYTPRGTVSVVPNTTTFYEVASVGKAPSVNEATSNFATAGVTVAVDGTDDEMLVFTAATTASAVTTTNFNAGELPSLSAQPTTVATGISSATFTGSAETNLKVTAVTYDKAAVSSATFSGTTATSAIVTGVTYDKAAVSAATFSGSSATITPTLTSTTKTATVSPV